MKSIQSQNQENYENHERHEGNGELGNYSKDNQQLFLYSVTVSTWSKQLNYNCWERSDGDMDKHFACAQKRYFSFFDAKNKKIFGVDKEQGWVRSKQHSDILSHHPEPSQHTKEENIHDMDKHFPKLKSSKDNADVITKIPIKVESKNTEGKTMEIQASMLADIAKIVMRADLMQTNVSSDVTDKANHWVLDNLVDADNSERVVLTHIVNTLEKNDGSALVMSETLKYIESVVLKWLDIVNSIEQSKADIIKHARTQ